MYSEGKKAEQQCVLSKRIAYTYIYPHIDLYTFNTFVRSLTDWLTQNVCMIHMLLLFLFLFLLLTLGHVHSTHICVCSETPIHTTLKPNKMNQKVSAKMKRKNVHTHTLTNTHAMAMMTMTTTTMGLSKTISKCLATNNLCWEHFLKSKSNAIWFDFFILVNEKTKKKRRKGSWTWQPENQLQM